MFGKENFNCSYCGKCCIGVAVKLSSVDIKLIKRLGYKRNDFTEEMDMGVDRKGYILKSSNGKCCFLKGDGEYHCSIYAARPEVCQKYPFFEGVPVQSCLPEVPRWNRS